jgi:hypothetical protein
MLTASPAEIRFATIASCSIDLGMIPSTFAHKDEERAGARPSEGHAPKIPEK